jgi:hypothetical protein
MRDEIPAIKLSQNITPEIISIRQECLKAFFEIKRDFEVLTRFSKVDEEALNLLIAVRQLIINGSL